MFNFEEVIYTYSFFKNKFQYRYFEPIKTEGTTLVVNKHVRTHLITTPFRCNWEWQREHGQQHWQQ